MKKSILSLMAASLTMICCKTQQKTIVEEKPKEEKKYDISHHIDERGNFKYMVNQNVIPHAMPDSIFAMGVQKGNKILINDRAIGRVGPYYAAFYEFKEAEELVRQRVSEENYNTDHLFVVKINKENKAEILKHENPEDHQAIFDHHSAIGQAKKERDAQNFLKLMLKNN